MVSFNTSWWELYLQHVYFIKEHTIINK